MYEYVQGYRICTVSRKNKTYLKLIWYTRMLSPPSDVVLVFQSFENQLVGAGRSYHWLIVVYDENPYNHIWLLYLISGKTYRSILYSYLRWIFNFHKTGESLKLWLYFYETQNIYWEKGSRNCDWNKEEQTIKTLWLIKVMAVM